MFAGFFKNLSIRWKLLFSQSLLTLAFIIVSCGIAYPILNASFQERVENELYNATHTIMSMVRTAANVSIKNRLRAIAEKNRDIAAYYYTQYTSGNMTEAEAKQMCKAVFSSQRIGKTGYLYCLNSQGLAVMHPRMEVEGVNLSHRPFIQEQIHKKEGYLEYDWKNPEDIRMQPKALYMVWFEPWDWIISVSSYRSEFMELIQVNDFKANILSLKFGLSGYAFIVSTNGDVVIHPKITGNLFESLDEKQAVILKTVIRNKNGKRFYSWLNPGEDRVRKKMLIYNYLPEYEWLVASSGYVDEFYAPIQMMKSLFWGVLILMLLIIIPFTFWLSSNITQPLDMLSLRMEQGTRGDLSQPVPVLSGDEIGRLAKFCNTFFANLVAEMQDRETAEHQLRQIRNDLERLVEDRTAELEVINKDLALEVAERKRIEGALRREKEKYQQIYENVSDWIYIHDTHGNLIESNEFFINKLGYTAEELYTMNLRDRILASQRSGFDQYIDRILKNGKDDGRLTILTRSDEERIIEYRNSVIHDDTGAITGIQGSARDITAWIATEKEWQIAQKAQEQAMDAKNRFITNMSHEIRSPLNVIMGMIQGLMETDPTALQKDHLNALFEASQRLLILVNKLADFSKTEAGETALSHSDFCLPAIMDRTASAVTDNELDRLTLLLVDDNAVNRKVASRILSRVGARVVECNSVQAALNVLGDQTVSAVLMDLSLEEMSGINAAQRIREALNLPDLPLIAMTAHSENACDLDCYNAGFNAIVTKPFNSEALYQTLRELVVRNADKDEG